MSQSTSANRTFIIIGAVALVVLAIVFFVIWLNRPAAQLKGSSDQLIDRLVAARPDQRDDLVIELGRRGPQIIPQAVAAYEKASNDPELRMQLAAAIFRTRSKTEAIPALERLLEKEKDPAVRNEIQNHILSLRYRTTP